jgi:hypothetical protein
VYGVDAPYPLVAACVDGGPADAPTPAAAPAAVDDYVESLAIASDAMRGLPPPPSEFVDASGVTAVVSVDTGAVSDGIRRAISGWQAALQGAAAADLDGTGLADGRAALLASSPVLVQEWTGVAREYAAGGRASLEGATPATVDAADALCAALDEADAASDGRAADTLDAARTRVEETVDALGAGG